MTDFQVISFSLVLALLILLAAFFACAETGLMAVNRYRLRHKARLKKNYAILLLKLLKRPDRLLGAILIGSTVATMLASSLATLLAYHFWGNNGALIAEFFVIVVVLIFAEITPKTVAAVYPDQVAKWVAYPIKIMLQALYPIVWFTNTLTNGLLRLLHIRITNQKVESLTREELRSVVYDTAGKISRQYQNMLLGILDLSKLTVDDVMIPRHEIPAINIEESWQDILHQLKNFHQDWVPFYRENMNQIMGILYTHDVMPALLSTHSLSKEILHQFLQEPYFVPEGTPLNVQLAYFQRNHDKVAFVVDEYGEIQGMLTLNDILEEIVGDFTHSMSTGKRIQLQADGSYLVNGAVTVREFNRTTNWSLPLRGPRTINGLIIEFLESLPHAGSAMLINNYPIEIIQVKENRVKQARIFPRLKK